MGNKLWSCNYFCLFFCFTFPLSRYFILIGPTFCEGPMKLGLSVHKYVHFLSHHFSQDWLFSFFLIFCMKLRDCECSKLKEPNFFEQILLVWKRAKKFQNGLIDLSVHYSSIFSQDWLIRFASHFAWSWRTISTQNRESQVFKENSCLPKNGWKWSKMLEWLWTCWGEWEW